MNDGAAHLEFETRMMFRQWLEANHRSSGGIWIMLRKKSKAFTAAAALEEAICFGWIDGQMKSIDETSYKKYFSRRSNKENWSEKNRGVYAFFMLITGLITQAGAEAYQYIEKENDSVHKTDAHNQNINTLKAALKNEDEILQLFEAKPLSRQKQFAGFYCDAKTAETREKRRAKIIVSLRQSYSR